MAATFDQVRELLESEDIVEFDKIVDLAVHGIPTKTRGEVWKYLLLVSKPDKSEEVQHERNLTLEYNSIDKSAPNEMKNSIKNQIARRYPKVAFFAQDSVQRVMERVIISYINLSGVDYSPGLVSLLGPFVYTLQKEVDVFWCFEAFMKKMEQYLNEETLVEKMGKFMIYLKSVQPELWDHFEEEELSMNEWAMSWVKFLLSKELPLDCTVRLWDTYFSSPIGFDLHVFVCLAILRNCHEELIELEVSELLGFLQHLPVMDMGELISKAYNLRDELKDTI